MSDNKNKYYTVVQTSIVKADNKTEALRAARNARRIPKTSVLSRSSFVERVSAVEAQTLLSENS